MSNYRLVFYGTEESQTEDVQLTTYMNRQNEIYVSIDGGEFPEQHICLNKSTAIKFAKAIRTEINKLQE